MKEEMTIEEGFEALSEILAKMDEESISLEDSFKLYNDGVRLVKDLNDRLSDAENKLTVVNEESV